MIHSPKPARRLISLLTNVITQCLFPGVSASLFEDSVTAAVGLQEGSHEERVGGPRKVTIDRLPDGVLLEIFSFYVDEDYRGDAWQTLVHVCGRWRQVVFASPQRLNLRLLCTGNRPVKRMLDTWPALPIAIVIKDYGEEKSRDWNDPNVDGALEHKDRICKIDVWDIPSPVLARYAASLMNEGPFPALTNLELWSDDDDEDDNSAPVLPDSFLGGSAPRLRTVVLEKIPFPGLPKLLSSAHDLVTLSLWNIPHSGYIPPDAMVACLSSLTGLKRLALTFRSPRSRPADGSRRNGLAPVVLPALTSLRFKGVSEYLEVLVSRIDVPLLNDAEIAFFNQLTFDTPLLRHFIDRTEAFRAFYQADVHFSHDRVDINLRPETTAEKRELWLEISCKPSDWQLSSMAQVCDSFLPPVSTLERLNIHGASWAHWQEDMENAQWIELFRPFVAVRDLYLDGNLAPRVVPTLQELCGEKVLSVLQNIFVHELSSSEFVQEAIGKFVATRQLTGCPVTVHNWERVW